MIIWILEYYDEGSDDFNINVFDSELGVKKQACSDILNFIGDLTLRDQSYIDEAKEINDLISQATIRSYNEAIRKWNSSSINTDIVGAYFTCRDMLVHPAADADEPEILDPSFFSGNVKQNITKNNHVPAASSSKISNSCGATCRKCHSKNEYAVADQSDGTYLCRSCKMFYNVFS